jgi:hypothetical protein
VKPLKLVKFEENKKKLESDSVSKLFKIRFKVFRKINEYVELLFLISKVITMDIINLKLAKSTLKQDSLVSIDYICGKI